MANITGDTNDNTLNGTTGDDNINDGNGGNDTLNGDTGSDKLTVTGGSDTVHGGSGDTDTLVMQWGGSTRDVYSSYGPYNTTDIYGTYTDGASFSVNYDGIERFQITTGSGNDTLIGSGQNDIINSGAGNDVVDVGAGNDTANGGAGTDQISADLSGATGAISWNVNANTFSSASSYGSFTNFETFGTLHTGVGAYNDTIVTSSGSHGENITTDGGNDSVTVYGGADTVHLGTGTDTLTINYSGASSSVYVSYGYYADGDGGVYGTVQETSGDSVNFYSAERFQISSGSASDTLSGWTMDDVINSGGGDDVVDVGSGNDTADGGTGSDQISADLSGATGAISWNVNANTFSSASTYGSFTNFEFFGTVTTGNGDYNDTIVTSTGSHGETINTNGGDDSVTVSGGGDTVHLGTGTDTLTINYSGASSSVYVSYGYYADGDGGVYGTVQDTSGDSVTFYSAEQFHINSGSAADTLSGWSMDDVINSSGGDDVVDVGAGNDTADGGTGNDKISADLSEATAGSNWNLQANTYVNGDGFGSFTNFEYFGNITGTAYDDTFVSTSLNQGETVHGGDGADAFTTVNGADNFYGEAGDDRLIIDWSGATGTSYVSYGLYYNGDSSFYGTFVNTDGRSINFDAVENVTFTGSAQADTLMSGAGDDVFSMGGGDDTADVGAGTNTVDGGTGTDQLRIDYSGASEGIDLNLSLTGEQLSSGPGSIQNIEWTGSLTGSAFGDTVVTTAVAQNDVVNTGAGNDSVTVVNGADTVDLGADNDRLVVDWSAASGTSSVSSGLYFNGDNSFYGSYSNSDGRSINFNGVENVTFTGSAQADSIMSAGGDDVFSMGGGNDTAIVGAGTNTVDGGTGTDQLNIDYSGASEGIDLDLSLTGEQLSSGPGSVQNIEWLGSLTGSAFGDAVVTTAVAQNDVVNTGAGNDSVTVVNGADTVDLGADNDRLVVDWSGASGTSSVSSGLYFNGDNSFYGSYSNTDGRSINFNGVENVTFTGSAQADSIMSAGGDDVFSMGGGDDFANVGTGTNTVDGGTGTDQLSIDYSGASEGMDLDLNRSGEQLAAGPGSIQNIEWVNALTGSAYADTIVTGTGVLSDNVSSGDGQDSVSVYNGSDTVDLGAADDTLVVRWEDSSGNSSVSSGYYSSGGDTFYGSLSNSDGRSISFTNAEHLVFRGGSGTDNIHGWSSSDALYGGGGDDTLDGYGGNDRIEGDGGTNTLTGGTGIDTVAYNNDNFGVTANLSTGTANNGGHGMTDTLTGFENLTGSAFADSLTGDLQTNVIEGGAGADAMAGGQGSDVYYVDNAGDAITENPGEGLDRVYADTSSYTLAANVEDMAFNGTGDFTGTGNASENLMAGGDGNDTLSGLDDKDTLIGNAGSDDLQGGTGADTLFGGTLGDNLVVNGSFEDLSGSQSSYEYIQQSAGNYNGVIYRQTSALDGWTSVHSDGTTAMPVELNTNSTNADFNVGDGLVALDLNTDGSGDNTTVYQDVSGVQAGESYLLSFSTALPTGGSLAASPDASLEVYWNGVLVGTVNSSSTDMEHHAFLVPGFAVGSGVGGTNRIEFREVGSDTDYRGTILDDVQLRSISDTDTAGNDTLDGGTGADVMVGGLGDDQYTVDDAGDLVLENASEGIDEVRTDLATFTLGDNFENLTGTSAGGQTLTGNGLDNLILGSSGNDTLTGLEGNDTLDGGTGADAMAGGIGDDAYTVDDAGDTVTEVAGQGTDVVYTGLSSYTLASEVENLTGTGTGQALTGNELANIILGTIGNDTLDGGVGPDTLIGGTGDDTYIVDDAGDFVEENPDEGTDTVLTRLNSATMSGNVENLTFQGTGGFANTANQRDNIIDASTSTGDDSLRGGDGNDTLKSGSGNDRLDGGTGHDTMIGGLGNDTYIVDNAGDVVTENPGEGTDTVRTDLASYTLGTDIENLTGISTAGQALTGNAGANVIRGEDGADVLKGAGGADTLFGNGGNDSLNGGTGADTMTGGTGNDTYFVDSAGDAVNESADGGTDLVKTALASYHLTANVENLIGTSTSGQALTGNDLANTLTADSGNDTLDGGAGADSMTGGAGDDSYVVDNADDIVSEGSGAGTDQVSTDLASYTLAVNVENLTGTSGTGQTLTGNGLNNVIHGQGGDDTLNGDAGADTLYGGAGNDTLDGGSAADVMIGGAGDDTYIVDAGDLVKESSTGGIDEVQTVLASYHLAARVENLTGTSGTGQALFGNGLDNAITGGDGGDTLNGGAGADTMTGGSGDDTYVVDDAGDVVSESDSAGTDTVSTNLASYTLGINFEDLIGTSATGQALTGNTLANVIIGAAGNDTVDGGAGADTMKGGGGDDTYIVDNAGDVVTENAGGIDQVKTSLAAYTLADHVENLTGTSNAGQALTGNALANVITGAAGDDTIDGGAGGDTMIGGLGNDVYVVAGAGDSVVEAAGQGSDKILTSLAAYTMANNVENLVGTSNSGQALTGNSQANTIRGGSGNDTLDGGAGLDHLYGNAGDDHYIVGGANDVVTESANQGTDLVSTTLSSYTLSENVENLTGTSSAGQTLTGNTLDNVIRGNAGNDTIDGGAGADTMIGGSGNDVYIVDNDGDKVNEGGIGGADEVRTSLASYHLAAGVDVLTGTAATGQSLTGNALDNTITGGGGNDTLIGGDGQDFLHGGAGTDTFVFANSDSSADHALADVIGDFEAGDTIDLTRIDADSSHLGNQGFDFMGTDAFDGTAGELHYFQDSGNTFIEGDVNGDGSADFSIQVTGLHDFVATDFML